MNSYCVSGAAGAPQAKGTRSIDKSNGEANAQVHRAKQGVKHSIKCHLINTPRSSININQRMMKLGLGFKAHSRRVIHCRDQLVFFLSSSFFLSLFLSIFCWFLFLVTVVLWEGSPVEQIYIYIYIYLFFIVCYQLADWNEPVDGNVDVLWSGWFSRAASWLDDEARAASNILQLNRIAVAGNDGRVPCQFRRLTFGLFSSN